MRDSSLLFQALELYELPFSGGSPAEQAIHCRSTRLQMTDCVQQACCVSTAKHANLISFSGSALPRSMLLSMYTTHTKKSTTSGVSVDSWNFRKQRISVCTFYIYVTELFKILITVNHILPKPYFLFPQIKCIIQQLYQVVYTPFKQICILFSCAIFSHACILGLLVASMISPQR